MKGSEDLWNGEDLLTQMEEMQDQIEQLQQEKEQLVDPSYVEKLAREDLGMTKDGEIPYIYQKK